MLFYANQSCLGGHFPWSSIPDIPDKWVCRTTVIFLPLDPFASDSSTKLHNIQTKKKFMEVSIIVIPCYFPVFEYPTPNMLTLVVLIGPVLFSGRILPLLSQKISHKWIQGYISMSLDDKLSNRNVIMEWLNWFQRKIHTFQCMAGVSELGVTMFYLSTYSFIIYNNIARLFAIFSTQ